MAFMVGTDERNAKEIGQGQVVSGFSKDVYVLDATTIANYDPADPASAWVRIKYVEDFQATTDVSDIKVYDRRDTDHTIAGRKESTLTIKQNYVVYHESVEKYENKQCFWMEAIADDREPVDTTTGKKIYKEMRIYDGKLAKFSFDKPTDNLYTVQGEGAYNTATIKKIFADMTPTAVTMTASGGNTATTSTPKSLILSASDLYNGTVDLLTANNEEILSVVITPVSGPSFTQSGTTAAPTVTYSTTGTSVIKCVITTKGNMVAESSTLSITVS